MSESTFLRLERIEVDGLFGTFDHRIPLNLEDRITLLHGPNGVGKTMVLRMVSALLQGRPEFLRNIPFSRFALSFKGGSTLTVEFRGDDTADGLPYTLSLASRGAEPQQVHTDLTSLSASGIASGVEYLKPHEERPNTWIDVRDGEVLDGEEILDRFGNGARANGHSESDVPWYGDFQKKVNVHLIEAQRLVRFIKQPESWALFRRTRQPAGSSAVIECGKRFQRRLSETMAEYGRESQRLDQSFPQRLVSAEVAEPDLEQRMAALERRMTSLKDVGILEDTPTDPSVENLQSMGETQKLVMTLYVQDTESKLNVLDELSKRTTLLLEILNQKYRHKGIKVDRKEGLVAQSTLGNTLALDALSSGEQHELVLHYDLLFRVPGNTIVLIDEPELSLHLKWQKRFLPDLLQILRLSNFDALIATHSPFIVGDRTDLMVGLGEDA